MIDHLLAGDSSWACRYLVWCDCLQVACHLGRSGQHEPTTPCLSGLIPLKSFMHSAVDYIIKNVMGINTLNPSNLQ